MYLYNEYFPHRGQMFVLLTLSMLGKNSEVEIFNYLFLIFPEYRLWYFMQIVS